LTFEKYTYRDNLAGDERHGMDDLSPGKLQRAVSAGAGS